MLKGILEKEGKGLKEKTNKRVLKGSRKEIDKKGSWMLKARQVL
jgi:hypothetical protein